MKLLHINLYFLLAVCVFLTGCFESSPPKGFDAVVPLDDNPMRKGCPNLIDTYQLTSAQEHNLLLKEPVAEKDFSYFVIGSLVADQAYNYALKMEPSNFIRKANELKNTDAEKYFYWRENTLQINKTYSEKLLSQVLSYGSAFERRGQFHVYGCLKGWVKIQEIETRVWDAKAEENYVKQDDVWLARNPYGDLLIHTISYQQKAGWTFWAAGGAGTRLIHIDDKWEKIRKAPDANFTLTWNEADLPSVKKPVHNTSECKFPEAEIINLNQLLLQNQIILEKFFLNPAAIKDGACALPTLLLGFQSSNSHQAKDVMELIKNNFAVDSIEVLETRADGEKLHYVVQVKFILR